MGIIENAKEAIKLVQQIDNIELFRTIVNLQSEAMELIDQVKLKDETISKLKDALAIKGNLLCEGSAYYITEENGQKSDGPFCTKCFDVDHITCRIISAPKQDLGHSWEWVQCPKCKVPFRSRKTGEYINNH